MVVKTRNMSMSISNVNVNVNFNIFRAIYLGISWINRRLYTEGPLTKP